MGLGDNLAGAILSALVVIPAICALSAAPEAANEALQSGATSDLHLFTFISYLQQSRVEDSFPLSSLGLLAIAAITSLFSMIEVGVKCVVDSLDCRGRK